MSKKKIILAMVSIGITTIGGGCYLYLKHKKKTNTNIESEKISDDNQYDDINDSSETDNSEIDTVDLEDMYDKNNVEEFDTLRTNFVKYLTDNGIDSNKIDSMQTLLTSMKNIDGYDFVNINKQIAELISTEFNITKIQDFDKHVFIESYSNIDPCQLFLTNTFKILSMGPEYQEVMMTLSDTLSDLIATNKSEIIETMYEIYIIFSEMSTDDISPSTYNEKFKKYVDKYVKSDEEAESMEV